MAQWTTRLVPAILLGLALGCAFTTETIHLEYKPSLAPAKVAGAEGIRVTVAMKDVRPNPSKEVARKINGFGQEMAPILNDEEIPGLVRRAVEAELKARGYDLEASGVVLSVELVVFMHRYSSGVFSGDSEATVTLRARVLDAAGAERFAETVSDTFKHAAGVFGGGNVKEAYEVALPGAVAKLMALPALHEALAKVGKPPSP
ncbi:MAG TPA: YajG family lipoprotein [Holophagaceae bacterium]|nr:YajG family lipoprotein [Holophagaceae bacterium]